MLARSFAYTGTGDNGKQGVCAAIICTATPVRQQPLHFMGFGCIVFSSSDAFPVRIHCPVDEREMKTHSMLSIETPHRVVVVKRMAWCTPKPPPPHADSSYAYIIELRTILLLGYVESCV